MSNLYTYRHSREEINLIGQQWSDVFEKRMAGTNDEARWSVRSTRRRS
jgi:hypothetical protein